MDKVCEGLNPLTLTKGDQRNILQELNGYRVGVYKLWPGYQSQPGLPDKIQNT